MLYFKILHLMLISRKFCTALKISFPIAAVELPISFINSILLLQLVECSARISAASCFAHIEHTNCWSFNFFVAVRSSSFLFCSMHILMGSWDYKFRRIETYFLYCEIHFLALAAKKEVKVFSFSIKICSDLCSSKTLKFLSKNVTIFEAFPTASISAVNRNSKSTSNA